MSTDLRPGTTALRELLARAKSDLEVEAGRGVPARRQK